MTEEEYADFSRLGKYKILIELGRGGMARVFQAEDSETGQTVALKALLPELAGQPVFVQRFRREIEFLKGLEHPNIVRILDVGVEAGTHYYVMEYMQGTIEGRLKRVGRFPVPEALDIIRSVAEALQYAHAKGVIHRDIKLSNIMTDAHGSAKLADFGIAKDLEATRMTGTGALIGTADYMSPEQAEGKQVTRKSDVYSLGVCLYEMLAARVPFVGRTYLDVMRAHRFSLPEPIKQLNPEVPSRVVQIVESMMEKDPAKRPSPPEVVSLIKSARGQGAMSTEVRQQVKAAAIETVQMKAGRWTKPIRIALFVVLAAILGWAGAKTWYSHFTTPEYKYSQGLEKLRSGKYDKAKYHFDAVTYFHPDSPVAGKAEDRLRTLETLMNCVELETRRKEKRDYSSHERYDKGMRDLKRGARDEGLGALRLLARDYPDTEWGPKAAKELKRLTGEDIAPAQAATPFEQTPFESNLQDQLYEQAKVEVQMGERQEGVGLLIRLAAEFPEAEVAGKATEILAQLGELPAPLAGENARASSTDASIGGK